MEKQFYSAVLIFARVNDSSRIGGMTHFGWCWPKDLANRNIHTLPDYSGTSL